MHTIFGFFLLSLGLAIYHVYLVSVNLTTWEQTRAGTGPRRAVRGPARRGAGALTRRCPPARPPVVCAA